MEDSFKKAAIVLQKDWKDSANLIAGDKNAVIVWSKIDLLKEYQLWGTIDDNSQITHQAAQMLTILE